MHSTFEQRFGHVSLFELRHVASNPTCVPSNMVRISDVVTKNNAELKRKIDALNRERLENQIMTGRASRASKHLEVAAEAKFEEELAAGNVASMPNDEDSGDDDPDDEWAKKPQAKRKSAERSEHTGTEDAKKRKAVAGRGNVAPVVAPQQSEYMPTSTNDGRNIENRRCSGAPFGCQSKASQCSGRRNCWKWCIGIREKQIQVPENENERQHIIREFRRKMNQRRVAEHRARNK